MAATEVMEATEERAKTAEELKTPVSFPPIKDEENTNSIDVDIENMVWEVEDEPDDLHRVVEEVMTEEEPHYADYSDDYSSEDRIARAYNKHLFTWVFNFVCGMYGVDRFCRGQISLGVLKLLTFGGFGIWYLADLIIAMTKSYMGEYSDEDDVYFDRYGRYL